MNSRSVPVIGITTYAPDSNRHLTLPYEYVEAVRAAGGEPLLLPPGATAEAILPLLDGLLLSGGGDLDSVWYGQVPHRSTYLVSRQRDTSELSLVKAALEADAPVLGVCRGCQVLNVALGGSLHQHLPDVVGERVQHRLPPREPTSHPVGLLPESRLAEILGPGPNTPASWHHQGIDRLGNGLRVVATAPDDTVEAVEATEPTWVIAVQWHPELTAAQDPQRQRLFRAFVRAAQTWRTQ